jgi:hypothetical protein
MAGRGTGAWAIVTTAGAHAIWVVVVTTFLIRFTGRLA